jgi:hypothetical protein
MLIVILWIVRCVVLSVAVQISGETCQIRGAVLCQYHASAILSIFGQVLFVIGGMFFFGTEFFKCCKNINTMLLYLWFSFCGAILLLISGVMDIALLKSINKRTKKSRQMEI